MSVIEQYHLRLSMNFAMHKIEPGTLTERTAKRNFTGTTKGFVARSNTFSFLSSVKETIVY